MLVYGFVGGFVLIRDLLLGVLSLPFLVILVGLRGQLKLKTSWSLIASCAPK